MICYVKKLQGHVDLQDELACDSEAVDFQDVFSCLVAGDTRMVL